MLTFTKYYATEEGFVHSNANGKLKGEPNNCHMGYLKVTLYADCMKRKTFLVHKFIWEFFNGAVPKGMQVDHDNGNQLDNRLSNLKLVTQSQNIRKRKGSISLEDEALLLAEYRATNPRPHGFVANLGKKYGVSRHTVNKIAKRN